MSSFRFALKRTLSAKVFMLFLLLTAAVVFLASFYGSFSGLPPAGICNLGSGEISQKVVGLLEERDFIEFASLEDMNAALEKGEIDCAVCLPADFDERLQTGEMESIVSFVQSPSAFLPMVYKSHVSAVLFSEYAPYLTADALAEYEIGRDEVLQSYDEMLAEGYRFSFELVSEDGTAPENLKACNLTVAAIAVLLFVAITLFSVGLMNEAHSLISVRIGIVRTMRHIILPGLLLRALLASLAAVAGLLAAALVHADEFYFSLMPQVFIYALLLVAATLLLAAILPKERQLNVLLTLLVLASMVLCPIFLDVSLLSPIIAAIRYALPCFWLWAIPENMLLWAAVAVIVLPLCYAIFLLRCKAGRKLNLR